MPNSSTLPEKALLGPDNLTKGIPQMPSAAAVLPRLLEVLNASHSSLQEVVSVLKLDAGIAAKLLQVSNSAFYNRGERCESLTEAVHKVGFLRVYEIVSITAAGKLFLEPLATYGLSAQDLWQRSVTTAIAAELLAERANMDPHLAYTVGLMHGVGMIAIDNWAKTQELFPLLLSQGYPKETTANELSVIGFTNASAAGAVLRSWGFPENLVDPVRWQYDPRATAMRNHPMACLLSVSKWIREVAHLQPGHVRPADPDRWALQLLRLNVGELQQLAIETKAALERVSLMLDFVEEPPHRIAAGADALAAKP